MNKRRADITVSTIIYVALAVIVLVVLALGFGISWTSLWGKITGYFSPVNVDSVKQACTYACTTQTSYDYCSLKRDVVVIGIDGKKDTDAYKGKTCNYLALLSPLGFEKCGNIDCPPINTCAELGGEWKSSCNLDYYEILTPEDTTDKGTNIICCKSKEVK